MSLQGDIYTLGVSSIIRCLSSVGKQWFPWGVFHLSSLPPATQSHSRPLLDHTTSRPLLLLASHHYDLPSSPGSGPRFPGLSVSLSSGAYPHSKTPSQGLENRLLDQLHMTKTPNQGLITNNEKRLLKQLHMTRMGKRSLPGLPPWMQVSRWIISQAFSLVQVDSEPDTMFSDYQNFGTFGPNLPDQSYGTYGPNFSGFKKRNNRLPFTFGLGK